MKKKYVKGSVLQPKLPILASIVAWLFYRELGLEGVGAGIYITIAGLLLASWWIGGFIQIFTQEPGEPVFKETK